MPLPAPGSAPGSTHGATRSPPMTSPMSASAPATPRDQSEKEEGHGHVLTVNSCIKVRLDLQADKSPVIVKGPFFPQW
jgi:hypothetical protein